MLLYIIVLIIFNFGTLHAGLPDGLEICVKGDDQELYDECTKDLLHDLRPYLAEGISSMEVPVMEPLRIAPLRINRKFSFIQLNLKVKNATVKGITDFQIKDVHFDTDNLTFDMKVVVPRILIRNRYNVRGSFFFIPLRGYGIARMELTKVMATIKIQFKEITDDDGVERLAVDDFRVFLQFPGSGRLKLTSPARFAVLNRLVEQTYGSNARKIMNTLKPVINKISSDIGSKILNKAITTFTKDELLLLE